ncbi:MAG: class I SAM-dependent methyltransferase [Gemmataceae bacterium]|nr:class I SAM-dependent methyltransferase [Gemmataceae bacterium]
MLPRVLEPEVMDSAEEAHNYDAMDHSTVNRLFVADFLAVWNGKGPILDVGTGTAQIPIELCRCHADAHVFAIDLAEHMLSMGRRNVEAAGFQTRLRLELRDAKKLSEATGTFGAIISNSIVHHIPEPGHVIAEMVRVLRPDGTLLVRDLLRPDDMATLQHLVHTYAGDANAHQQKMFAESLHAALTLVEIRDLVASHGGDRGDVAQTSDRHWTWCIKPAK